MSTAEMANEIQRMAVALYLELPKAVADDIAERINRAAAALRGLAADRALVEDFGFFLEHTDGGQCYCERCEAIRERVHKRVPWVDCPDCDLGWAGGDPDADEGRECSRCEGMARIPAADRCEP